MPRREVGDHVVTSQEELCHGENGKCWYLPCRCGLGAALRQRRSAQSRTGRALRMQGQRGRKLCGVDTFVAWLDDDDRDVGVDRAVATWRWGRRSRCGRPPATIVDAIGQRCGRVGDASFQMRRTLALGYLTIRAA